MQGYIYLKADEGKIFVNKNDKEEHFFNVYLPLDTDISKYEQIDYNPEDWEEEQQEEQQPQDSGTTIE